MFNQKSFCNLSTKKIALGMSGIFFAFAANAFVGVNTPQNTKATFKVSGIAPISAVFKDLKGTVKFDINDIAATKYDVELNTTTLDAGIKTAIVKSSDFLDTAKYPTMAFHSTHNEKIDDFHMKMYGGLTIVGVTKPIVWDVKLDPNSNNQLAKFVATTTIDRTQWGITALTMVASKTINIRVDQTMTPK